MKIAVVSDNGESVGQHFGRARSFVVVTIEDGTIASSETRESNRIHGTPEGEGRQHGDCFDVASVIDDCDAVIVGGMGNGAYVKFQAAGIRPVLTDEMRVEAAAVRYAEGDLPDLPDRLHGGGHHTA